ncbi:MAG: DNA polymerase III subunit delta [Deltaproteobacteria bacterium]|nr:DNA polymerase III subunit delta [Deltaproteobacteria bacterium]
MAATTPKGALADIEKGKAAPAYYLYGEEPFKIDEFIEKATAAMFGASRDDDSVRNGADLTFCVDRIDGATATGNDVLEAVQSMGLFGGSGKRLVIVRQAHQLKEVDALADTLMGAGKDGPWGENVLLLAAETLDGRRKFHQWFKKKELALEFKPARDAELAQWVQYLAKKTGAKVSGEAAGMLAVISDGSLYRLAQEIEKAWLFAGGTKGLEITVDHVSGVGTSQVTHEMIELVRAVLEGKRTRGLLLSEKLIRAPEDALGLVGFLTWALKNPGRGFSPVVSGGLARTRQLVGALVTLDFRLKSSGVDANALVEEFVIEHT